MVNICDMKSFPQRKYFRQYEIPRGTPKNYPYEYTRALVIRLDAELDRQGALKKLNPVLEELSGPGATGSPTRRDPPGIPARLRPWERIASDLLPVSILERSTNPIDFQLWSKSRIIFLLDGDFWRFSSKLAPLTTKHRYEGQYFDLRRHISTPVGFKSLTESEWEQSWSNYSCNCISFFTGEPCPDDPNPQDNVRHGFSLNIELLHLDSRGRADPDMTLPITFDPDIENKGGHGLEIPKKRS